jgi:hypothetical protein
MFRARMAPSERARASAIAFTSAHARASAASNRCNARAADGSRPGPGASRRSLGVATLTGRRYAESGRLKRRR